jgi:hypothetical protein
MVGHSDRTAVSLSLPFCALAGSDPQSHSGEFGDYASEWGTGRFDYWLFSWIIVDVRRSPLLLSNSHSSLRGAKPSFRLAQSLRAPRNCVA